jgi:hypothetical protein
MRGLYLKGALALAVALPVPVEARAQQAFVGVPSDSALLSALRKERLIAGGGVNYVRLSPNEIASILQARLDPAAQEALDSLRLTLSDDRITLEGQLLMETVGRELLGAMAGYVQGRQPIRVTGVVAVRDTGVVSWTPDEVTIMALNLPQAAIPRLVNYLTGGTDGAFLLPVPRTVGEVHVSQSTLTFYRWPRWPG